MTEPRPCTKCGKVSKIQGYNLCKNCYYAEDRLKKGFKLRIVGERIEPCVKCHVNKVIPCHGMCQKCYARERRSKGKGLEDNRKPRACVKCYTIKRIIGFEMCNICYQRQYRLKKGIKSRRSGLDLSPVRPLKHGRRPHPKNIRLCIRCHAVSKIKGHNMCENCFEPGRLKAECAECHSFGEIHARGMCNECYYKNDFRSNAECAECHSFGEIHARGMCRTCYYRSDYRTKAECVICNKFAEIHGDGMCGGCYKKEHKRECIKCGEVRGIEGFGMCSKCYYYYTERQEKSRLYHQKRKETPEFKIWLKNHNDYQIPRNWVAEERWQDNFKKFLSGAKS